MKKPSRAEFAKLKADVLKRTAHQSDADRKNDLASLRAQFSVWDLGHVYDGPDCILCGHFGPVDDPDEPCRVEKLLKERKR